MLMAHCCFNCQGLIATPPPSKFILLFFLKLTLIKRMFMHATVENYVLRRRYMYVEIERTPLPRTIFHASDNSYPKHDFFSFWCSHKISP